jgi:hypothetical protein
MKAIWNPSIEQYLEAVDLAKSRGKKPGESFETEFFEVMNKYNMKPSGFTELNKDEMIQETLSHGKSILDLSVDEKGKGTFKTYKPEDKV